MSETVTVDGFNFQRYPESPNASLRKYFYGWCRVNGVRQKLRLHVYLWLKNMGPIPKGYHIHHKDGNTLNNDLSNLRMMEGRTHLSEHYAALPDEVKEAKKRALLEKALPASKAWHKSDEGREWHRKHAQTSMFGEEKEKTCAECGTRFKTTFKGRKRFCGTKCKEHFHNQVRIHKARGEEYKPKF